MTYRTSVYIVSMKNSENGNVLLPGSSRDVQNKREAPEGVKSLSIYSESMQQEPKNES